jgi:hypothetical protein
VASASGGGDPNAAKNASADAVSVGRASVVTPVPVSGSALALLAAPLAPSTLAMRRRPTRPR